MKVIINALMFVVLTVIMFLLSYVYMIAVELARGFMNEYCINLAVFVPLVALAVFYSCANEATKGVKNKGFAALGLFISAMSFIYGNWVFLIHHICDEWLWKPLELIQGARMIADMHEVRVIFNWTGGGLVFAYWVEALALIIGLVCGVNQDGDKPKKECKESKDFASETKKVSSTVVMLVALMGALFSGCSSEKTKYVLPDSEAVAEWANNQNWEEYEDGKTFLAKNLNGTTYIGIGIAEVPKNEKLIKLNQMRTKALAIKALFNEVEEEIEDPSVVAVVYNEDVDVKGVKKQITVVATATSRTAVPNATGVTEEDVASIDGASLRKWAKEQDWSKYAIGGTAITTNLNGEVVIGVGVVDVSKRPQYDKYKARMMAIEAISKGLNSSKVKGVVTVYKSQVKVGDSERFLVVLAKKK